MLFAKINDYLNCEPTIDPKLSYLYVEHVLLHMNLETIPKRVSVIYRQEIYIF